MKLLKIVVAIAVFSATAAFSLSADGIRWEKAKNISGDADVRTDGVLRYAYANKAATVNGVAFAAGVNVNSFPDNVATMADVTLTSSGGYIDSDYFAKTVPSGASAEYLQLIRAAVYNTSAANGESVTSTITLKNLIPGHAYIVQLWTHDERSDPGSYRSIKVDDTEELLLRASTGFGQHVTGAFTAAGNSQSFTVTGYAKKRKSVSQINSLQLRDVTPGQIAWEDAKDITDDSDVRTDGECVFAAGWMAATAVVNNVVFVPLSPTNDTTVYRDVRMTTENMLKINRTAFVENMTQTLSDDYSRLMAATTYADVLDASSVTLEGLVPGGRYLVQLWVNDTRTTFGPYRCLEVDGGRRVKYSVASGNCGQHITGVFTADGTSKSLKLTPFYKQTKDVTYGNTQLNAIQLRRLDSGAATHWRVSSITKRDHDVRLDGELLYAYNFTTGEINAEINGVTFKGWMRPSASASTDDIAIVLPSVGNSNASAYGITDSNMTPGYKLMHQSATYSGNNDTTPSTLTLKRLTPGRRYLVQLWVHDGRTSGSNGKDAKNRYIDLDGGVARLEYQNDGLFSPARGDVATGIFTATGTAHTVTMLPGIHSGSSRSVQLNGMQVRDLGEVADSAFNVWAGGA